MKLKNHWPRESTRIHPAIVNAPPFLLAQPNRQCPRPSCSRNSTMNAPPLPCSRNRTASVPPLFLLTQPNHGWFFSPSCSRNNLIGIQDSKEWIWGIHSLESEDPPCLRSLESEDPKDPKDPKDLLWVLWVLTQRTSFGSSGSSGSFDNSRF